MLPHGAAGLARGDGAGGAERVCAATWPGVWRGGAGAAPVRPDAPDMWAAGCMLAQLLATGIAVRCSAVTMQHA